LAGMGGGGRRGVVGASRVALSLYDSNGTVNLAICYYHPRRSWKDQPATSPVFHAAISTGMWPERHAQKRHSRSRTENRRRLACDPHRGCSSKFLKSCVRAIPWPSGRWRARRRIDTGHAGRLHSRERARGHVQPRCRGGGNVGREKGCRRRHRSGGGPPASRDADGRVLHSAAQRTSNRSARLQADGPPQQKPARRHDHPRVIAGAFNPRSRCARSPRPTRGGGRW